MHTLLSAEQIFIEKFDQNKLLLAPPSALFSFLKQYPFHTDVEKPSAGRGSSRSVQLPGLTHSSLFLYWLINNQFPVPLPEPPTLYRQPALPRALLGTPQIRHRQVLLDPALVSDWPKFLSPLLISSSHGAWATDPY